MIHKDIVQGTDEWFELKLGKVSASRIADVMATIKSGEAASRRNYKAKLVAEILTGEYEETFQSADMARGVELEADARLAYEFAYNASVEQVGFIDHPSIEGAGCSPDGLIDKLGMVEIKCPKTATHLFDYIIAEEIPRNYMLQMQFQMDCYGADWCDFVSYQPKLPVNLQLHVVRVFRDNQMISDIREAVESFIAELNDIVHALKKRGTK